MPERLGDKLVEHFEKRVKEHTESLDARTKDTALIWDLWCALKESDMTDPIPPNANPLIVSALNALTCNQDYEVEATTEVIHLVTVHTVHDGAIVLAVTLIGVRH